MKAKNPKRWFIYRMRCLIEGVGDYVGMTHNPFQREKEHRAGNKNGKLAAAIALYGEINFIYGILDECETEEQARILERQYIQKLGTGWPRGLNTVHAGEGVYADQYDKRRASQIKRWDDEEKRRQQSDRVKRALSGKTTRELLSAAAKRRWADPAYRAKQSAAATDKKHSEETKQKIRAQKLAASAARGGPKGRPKAKYPGLSAHERGRIVTSRPDVQAKTRATWEKNKDKNIASIRAANAVHNIDPVIIAKRTAGIKAAAKRRGKITLSAETRAKMAAAQTARWAQIKLLQNPKGNA